MLPKGNYGIWKSLEILMGRYRYKYLSLQRILCNGFMQMQLEYECSPWCAKLSKEFTTRLSVTLNSGIRYCLQLDQRTLLRINLF